MITAIQLSSIKAYMQSEADIRASLARLAQIGYTHAQLQWHTKDVPVSAVADALRASGITAVSLQDFTHEILADAEYYLSLADACGFSDITISGIPADELSPEGVARFAERIAPLHRRLMREGKTLTFHPRWQELYAVGGKTPLSMLLENADASLRVLPDMNHVFRAGLDAKEFFASVAGRIDFIHAKDMTDTTREKSHLTPVGQGCIPWETVIPTAERAGARIVFAEQESWDKDAFVCMEESYRYLKSFA